MSKAPDGTVGRLIVVLGYSAGDHQGLHPICAQRVDHAARIATEHDVVVLSGWARVPGTRPEAELMAQAWTGSARELVIDPDARTTVGNASNALDDLRRTGATEVVIVTSRWHMPRALAVFRWRFRGLDKTIVGSAPPERGRYRDRFGEIWRWAALPVQLAVGEQPVALRVLDQRLDTAAVFKRAALLLVGALSLYLLAPTLLEVFGSFDTLSTLRPGWLALIGATQLLALGCLWSVQRLVLGGSPWSLVISSQLASNAASRLIPGGAATGTAVHYRLLRSGGISTDMAASGLAVASLLQIAFTLALPAIALPAIAIGTPAPNDLLRVAWAGGGLFVLLVVLTAATLADDRLLSGTGRSIDRLRSLVQRSVGTGSDERRATGDGLLERRDDLVERLDGHWGPVVTLTAARSSFDYLSLVVAMAAIGADGRLSLLLLAYAAATLLGMIPVTPGGLGFVEAGLTGTLALAGISAGDAVAITLIYRLFSFWMPIPAGLIAAVLHSRRYR